MPNEMHEYAVKEFTEMYNLNKIPHVIKIFKSKRDRS